MIKDSIVRTFGISNFIHYFYLISLYNINYFTKGLIHWIFIIDLYHFLVYI